MNMEMDHSHHGHDMGGMDMGHGSGHRCSMSMLFTWNTKDLCLVFRWWHVSGPISLVVSLLAVVALGMGYEYLRKVSRRYEARVNTQAVANNSGVVGGSRRRGGGRLTKGLLYGAQVFYSFFIMLLFMTYNGWVMIAVAVGAFLGYVVWGDEDASAAKSVACH